MKLFVYTMFLTGSAVSGLSQTDTVAHGEIRLSARVIHSDGSLRKLEGLVRIETPHVIIEADQAAYNSATADIQASGNVHVTLKEK